MGNLHDAADRGHDDKTHRLLDTPSAQRGIAAVLAAAGHVPNVEPLAAFFVRARRRFGEAFEPHALLAHWGSRSVGTLVGPDRYRWELTHKRGTGIPQYAGSPATWQAWRASEAALVQRDAFAFEELLLGPIATFESAELLAESPAGQGASALLHEAEPVLRRDFAQYALERNAWADTFPAWCLCRYPVTFNSLRSVLVAVVETYTARARSRDGIVLGTRFPFHEQALVSASAQLALASLTLGCHFDVAARVLAFVAAQRRADGGWGDGDDPSDLLTTLVALDLLSHFDPEFDSAPTVDFMNRRQEADGYWRAFGPEAPWLTAMLVEQLRDLDLPFAKRFRFPRAQPENLDRKTRLPSFAYFTELSRLFAEMPGLAHADVELGFIDLIGFRAFNNRYGQAQGDEVLRLFADELSSAESVCSVRDGGDEFLLLGAPGGESLERVIGELQRDWPAVFHATFGAEASPVLARAVVGRCRGANVLAAREELGRAIGELKTVECHPKLGILRRIELGA
jgi:GGDEF domain-containing protein